MLETTMELKEIARNKKATIILKDVLLSFPYIKTPSPKYKHVYSCGFFMFGIDAPKELIGVMNDIFKNVTGKDYNPWTLQGEMPDGYHGCPLSAPDPDNPREVFPEAYLLNLQSDHPYTTTKLVSMDRRDIYSEYNPSNNDLVDLQFYIFVGKDKEGRDRISGRYQIIRLKEKQKMVEPTSYFDDM